MSSLKNNVNVTNVKNNVTNVKNNVINEKNNVINEKNITNVIDLVDNFLKNMTTNKLYEPKIKDGIRRFSVE